MASKFGSWWQKSWLPSWWAKIKSGLQWLWQKIRQHPFIATGIIVVLIALTAFAFLVHIFGWDWTGFTGYSPPTPQYQRGKTLWDWLQLLFVPIILTIGGFWLNQLQKSREQKTTEQQAVLERELTRDNQQETLLQGYIDKMSELLLEEHLRESDPDAEVRKIARVRTLTVLPRLDADRKRSVLQFLYEAGLIHKDKYALC